MDTPDHTRDAGDDRTEDIDPEPLEASIEDIPDALPHGEPDVKIGESDAPMPM